MFRKVTASLLAFALVIGSTGFAESHQAKSQSDTYERLGVQVIEIIPKGVEPLHVNSLEELEEVINNYELDNTQDTHNTPDFFNTPYSLMSARMSGTKTDTRRVFKLSNVGAELKSRVEYEYQDIQVQHGPPKREFTVIDHDVFENGTYGFQRVKLDDKKAVPNSSKTAINVHVDGLVEIFITVSVKGGATEFVLKQYEFDKRYTIRS